MNLQKSFEAFRLLKPETFVLLSFIFVVDANAEYDGSME